MRGSIKVLTIAFRHTSFEVMNLEERWSYHLQLSDKNQLWSLDYETSVMPVKLDFSITSVKSCVSNVEGGLF